ncbi:hypothetical protein F2Q70_00038782, partial [Brassica cretica]
PMAEFVVKEAAFPFNPKGFLFRFDFSDHHSTGILVAITQVLWKPRGLLVDQFDSKSDLINAVHTSSFIPGYLAPRPVTMFRNRVCVDGGLTLFMPPSAAAKTVRVCAFSASSFKLKGIGISPDCNPLNRATARQLLKWALEPAEDEVLDRLFELGYADAATWSEMSPVDELVYDDSPAAQAIQANGHIIRVSKDDIRNLLERASMDEPSYLCLPEHARSFTLTKLVQEIYTQDEINEMLYGICGAQEKNEDDFQMKLDGVYYPLNDSISWLTTCMEEMRQDIARMQTQRAAEATTPASIDRDLTTSIDADPSQSNPMKSQPDSYTRAEIDQMTEAMQRKIVEIQRYIARRPEATASIDGRINIPTDSPRRTSIDEVTN